MSDWALELQQFNIERIWIRGQANILADAPSRAPWEETLAQFLPIPDMPVRDLIIKLYQAPEEVDDGGGTLTLEFGERANWAREILASFGKGRVLERWSGLAFPCAT